MKAGPVPFNLGEALGKAVALHRQGQLREAERIYAHVLKAAPEHFAKRFNRNNFGAALTAQAP